MKNDLQQKIDETLSSLDGMRRAEASPFLYSKIRNRLQGLTEYVPQSLAWRMIAALVIVTLMNVLTLRHFKADKQSKSGGAESVATEYNISLPQTY